MSPWFIAFIIFMGCLVVINAWVSVRSNDPALKMTSFILASEFTTAIGIQYYIYPPERQLWLIIVAFCLFMFVIFNRNVYTNRPALGTGLGVYYIVAMGLLVSVLATHTKTVFLYETVTNAIFVILNIISTIMGRRVGPVSEHVDDLHAHRDIPVRHSHRRSYRD